MHGVLAERRHDWKNHNANSDASGARVVAGKNRRAKNKVARALQRGCDHKQREESVDHRGHARQNFNDGFQDGALSSGGVLAHVNRGD